MSLLTVRANMQHSLLLVLGIIFVSWSASAAEVTIPNSGLDYAIRTALNKPSGPLLDTDLATLTTLDGYYRSIDDLTGIEYCSNLVNLDLSSNRIVNVTALAGLTHLTDLNLEDNGIVDVTPLAGLTNLVNLNISSNQVSNLTPLAGLNSLNALTLEDNFICNLAPLLSNAGLATGDTLTVFNNPLSQSACSVSIPALTGRGVTVDAGTACSGGGFAQCPTEVTVPDAKLQAALRFTLDQPTGPLMDYKLAGLTFLLISYSQGIIDLTGIEHCTALTELHLQGNQIVDLTPLAGLTNLNFLDLGFNRITDLTPLAGLTNLATLTLSENAIVSLTPLSGLTGLSKLELDRNDIYDVSPLASMIGLHELDLSYNSYISIISPLVDNAGLASGDILTLIDLPLSLESCCTTVPALAARGVSIDTNYSCSGPCPVEVTFPDPGLEAAVRDMLGQPTGPLMTNTLAVPIALDAYDRGIKDLTGLEYCTNLSYLNLYTNQITDLSPIAGLTDMRELDLHTNKIIDLSPLAAFTSLEGLDLRDNQIVDLGPLAGLGSLTRLNLSQNQISNLSPLGGLGSLDNLGLSSNLISVLTPLATLDAVRILYLNDNQISGIAPLFDMLGLQNGGYLEIKGNPLSTQTCCTDLGALQGLYVMIEQGDSCPMACAPEGEGTVEGEGVTEGTVEGTADGTTEGTTEGTAGEGSSEGALLTVETRCTFELSGASVVPPVTTDSIGMAGVYYIPELDQTLLQVAHTVVSPTGAAILSAAPLQNGTQVLDLGSGDSSIMHVFTPSEEAALQAAGSLYLVIKSAAFPNGELRGQFGDGCIGVSEGAAEGGVVEPYSHTTDHNHDGKMQLNEVLRVIQLFNAGAFHCDSGNLEDGYALGNGDTTCPPYSADFQKPTDFRISLSELLRVLQLFNNAGYYACPGSVTEDGFCIGTL